MSGRSSNHAVTFDFRQAADVGWSANGRYLAAKAWYGRLRVWDAGRAFVAEGN